MKTYKVHWNCCKYATSFVKANDKREAKEKANADKDYDFIDNDVSDEDWLISDIQETEEK